MASVTGEANATGLLVSRIIGGNLTLELLKSNTCDVFKDPCCHGGNCQILQCSSENVVGLLTSSIILSGLYRAFKSVQTQFACGLL